MYMSGQAVVSLVPSRTLEHSKLWSYFKFSMHKTTQQTMKNSNLHCIQRNKFLPKTVRSIAQYYCYASVENPRGWYAQTDRM